MDEYKVDKNISIPDEKKKLPLTLLEVDESFEFPLSRRNSVQALASRLKKVEGKEFTIKKTGPDTARIWRVR